MRACTQPPSATKFDPHKQNGDIGRRGRRETGGGHNAPPPRPPPPTPPPRPPRLHHELEALFFIKYQLSCNISVQYVPKTIESWPCSYLSRLKYCDVSYSTGLSLTTSITSFKVDLDVHSVRQRKKKEKSIKTIFACHLMSWVTDDQSPCPQHERSTRQFSTPLRAGTFFFIEFGGHFCSPPLL